MSKHICALLGALLLLLALGACAGPETWIARPYLEVNGEVVESPALEDLRTGLENLDGREESYVYLELAQPLEGVWYLSAALPLTGYEDGLGYILEACADDGMGGYSYLQYRTQDQEQVLAWFEDFFRGKAVPDLSDWEDITDWYFDDYYSYDYGYDYDYGYGYEENPIAPV